MRRNAISLGLVFAFFFAIALSASPQLHERFHPDAKQAQHECAVTFIAAGNYHQAAPAPVVIAAMPPFPFSQLPALDPSWVASPFLSARIFEHAPPAQS